MESAKLQNQIRRLRFEHGEMTQQKLADLAHVTRQTIIALEASRYNPSLLLALRISKVFGVSVDDVFQYHE
ncbi:MAG: helix-turn-helix transcriptional regulator [Candidatus Aegiribacteria sp.]|nr:helix-turn-helix transcriptional regulator [Candidatus Aegiribacteria sp.]